MALVTGMREDFHKQTTQPDLTSSERAPTPLPQKIGPYKIESLLNKGGMSYLYLGFHPGTNQPIAIKVLSPRYTANQEMAGRFLREAHIIAMTNHPNIVKLYGQGTWEKGLYIAMEFIQGISLRQFIQQKSLSQRRALEIILQVAYALCHLHTHGVIHRDLKPENILITESGDIKVIDFGIAQLQSESLPETASKTRRMMGTPIYMSPEQKENPLSVTYASDIYSLGVIAYELILGRLSHGIIHLALLPKQLRPIIEKALQPNPLHRFQDIVDFITEISQYLKSLETHPEENKEDISAEVLDMIQYTRTILTPQKIPRWPPVELGLAIQKGGSLYLDFFSLPENRFAIVLAEPLEGGVASLLHSSILRGMMRMAVEYSFHTSKKDLHPIKMLSGLNHALFEDPMRQKFGLALLLLNSEKDNLTFVSCGYSSLWHIPEGSKKVRILSTPNPPLGSQPQINLLETADNWNSGDTLLLTTSSQKPDELPLLLSPQPQAEQILEQISSPNRASAVLSIHRIF
ncbi:MAG: protein kinase [Verrucomicrobiota bacterium]|nr:protein kinase [Verrucomicrobiota bacterium]